MRVAIIDVTMDSLEPGLYAELVTYRLAALLQSSTAEGQSVTALLRDADAAERLGRYIGDIVAEAVLALDEDKRAAGGLDIITSLLSRLDEHSLADPRRSALRACTDAGGNTVHPPRRHVRADRRSAHAIA